MASFITNPYLNFQKALMHEPYHHHFCEIKCNLTVWMICLINRVSDRNGYKVIISYEQKDLRYAMYTDVNSAHFGWLVCN